MSDSSKRGGGAVLEPFRDYYCKLLIIDPVAGLDYQLEVHENKGDPPSLRWSIGQQSQMRRPPSFIWARLESIQVPKEFKRLVAVIHVARRDAFATVRLRIAVGAIVVGLDGEPKFP